MMGLDALRGRIRDGRAARQRRAALKRHGLAVLPLRRDMPEAEDDLAALDRLWQAGELDRFDALYAAAEARDLMMGNALKLHVVLWTKLLARAGGAGDGPALDRLCEPFARWWERSGTPMAGAAYASALLSAAFAHRGGGYVDTVSEARWAAFNARIETGRGVLDACAASGAGSLPWAWTHYDYGLHGNDGFEDFQGRFMRAWSLDTANWQICVAHGVRLLPRWFGDGMGDLDGFARHAASVGQDRFGAGLYALIYGRGYAIGDHDVRDTLCDVDLLMRGYEDLAARYPCQSIYNRWAAGLYFARRYGACAEVFRTRITAIVPEIWLGDREEEQVDDALDTIRAVGD
ncbi:hypothetical protein [uncultured Methylobacterium sp.]|uniref:hypothetical protein n=1 Tax=uncultured Methylobacterium sp. TaxID=157278 RepID=UPI002592D2EF|nr:hypothetical protein [uncultured Methylobacterium sp.]